MKTLHSEPVLIFLLSIIFTPMGVLVAIINIAAASTVIWRNMREESLIVKRDFAGSWKAYFRSILHLSKPE